MSAAAIISVVFGLAILTAAGLVFRRVWVDLRVARRRVRNREAGAAMTEDPRKREPFAFAFMIGLGPTLLFVFSYLVAPVAPDEKIFVATWVFVAATTAAIVARLVKPGRRGRQAVWPKLLVIVMGGLTLWLRDETFIKVRPTLQYAGGAAWGLVMLATARPRLETMLARENVRLDRVGFSKLVIVGAALGILMALLNEIVWRTTSTTFWMLFQLWGPILFATLFALVGIPALRRHLPEGECGVRTAE